MPVKNQRTNIRCKILSTCLLILSCESIILLFESEFQKPAFWMRWNYGFLTTFNLSLKQQHHPTSPLCAKESMDQVLFWRQTDPWVAELVSKVTIQQQHHQHVVVFFAKSCRPHPEEGQRSPEEVVSVIYCVTPRQYAPASFLFTPAHTARMILKPSSLCMRD